MSPSEIKLDGEYLSYAVYSPTCMFCKNIISYEDRKCKAFDSIPKYVWNGENKHLINIEGDKGYTFEREEQK